MRRRTHLGWAVLPVVAMAVATIAAPTAAAATAAHDGVTPAPNGPTGGTVPGLTGAAARAAAGIAGTRFAAGHRQLAPGRTSSPDASATLHADFGTLTPTTSSLAGAMATSSRSTREPARSCGKAILEPHRSVRRPRRFGRAENSS